MQKKVRFICFDQEIYIWKFFILKIFQFLVAEKRATMANGGGEQKLQQMATTSTNTNNNNNTTNNNNSLFAGSMNKPKPRYMETSSDDDDDSTIKPTPKNSQQQQKQTGFQKNNMNIGTSLQMPAQGPTVVQEMQTIRPGSSAIAHESPTTPAGSVVNSVVSNQRPLLVVNAQWALMDQFEALRSMANKNHLSHESRRDL